MDSASITELICACCIGYILYIGISEFAFRFWNGTFKEIKREWRLLGALLKDYDQVLTSADEIKGNAGRLFESGLMPDGLTVPLMNEEKGWITNARAVVSYVESFGRLRKRRKFPNYFFFVVIDLPQMLVVAYRMKYFNDVLRNKETCALIYRSLEQLRSKVQRLQDRSTLVVKSTPQLVGLISADEELLISSLKNPGPDLHSMYDMEEQIKSFIMHLQLLHAFIKDLRRLKVLETEMERSWVIAANKTLYKAKDAIGTISRSAANQRASWLSDFSSWRASQKLKEDIMCFDTRIKDLLEQKERYGFKFVRRDSSKSAHRSPQICRIADDLDFPNALKDIRNWLNQLPKTSSLLLSRVSSLNKKLEQMQKNFEDTRATEHASNARYACLEQLKKMTFFTTTHMEDKEYLFGIKQIEDAVIALQRCMKVYSIEVRKESCSVVGLEEDVHELVRRLTDDSEKPYIISIRGMMGIGKTTLAKKVFHHRTIANHFKELRWVTVPQWSNENALWKSVGSQVLLNSQEKESRKYYWTGKVHDFLKNKKCLLVLDHVQSRETFDDLKAALIVLNDQLKSGSRIVLTTRNKAFASHATDHQNIIHYPLRLRTQEESWEFFTQMVHISSDSEEETIAKKVVRRTGGLPFVIFRLGYLLSRNKVTSEELLSFLERITRGRNQTPWLDTLAMNKNDLQEGYFELFPGDFEIPARRLVALWVSKGLEADISVAYKLLSELIERNVIQVLQRKPNGDVKTCCFPSALRELWLQDKGDNSRTRSWSLSTSSDQKHIAYHFDDNDASFSRINGLNTNSPNVLQNGRYPHSILFFDTREGNKPGEEIGDFLGRGIACGFFQQLEVLDLERVFRPQLPKSIGTLKKLTYLGLRWTYLETIPESIGNLAKLQTLDLKHTHVRTLPSSIWKLGKLLHLYLNQNSRIKFMTLPTAFSMKNLQTLSGVFVDKSNLLKDRLGMFIHLQKLGLAFQLAPEEQKVLAKCILKLTDLQSLKLASINDKSLPQHLKLKPLLDLKKLSSLYLFGKLDGSSIIKELPESLTRLTLSSSGIGEDPMPMLGKLPKLKSLSLNAGSYQGTDMVCSMNDFPQLCALKLWNLGALKKLEVQQGAMRNLRELEIRSCENLTITTGLTDLKILQEIKLTNMPEKCTGDIENDFAAAVPQSADQIIHSPAIIIDNW